MILFKPRTVALYIVFLSLFSGSTALYAHGGVDYGRDACILTVGPYQMNFTGYLPLANQSEEFCDDIPDFGKAIVVLDFLDKSLRNMDIDLRILKDVKGIGITATYEDLGNPSEIGAATQSYLPPKKYGTGTMVYEFDYPEAGRFIGVLTVKRESDGKVFTSVFPYSVGIYNTQNTLSYFVGALLLLLGGWYVFTILRQRKAVADI